MSAFKAFPGVLLMALALVPSSLSAHSFPVREFVLKNGMKVLVQEDHGIPNVALYTFYRIGSRNERPGTTGISHFFEHMMFNGAKKYGPGEFDRVMEAFGGHNNAYTSANVTVYSDWFPAGEANLEKMFDMEADRIQDLAFDPKMIESERGVVASERRMSVDNSNFGILYEQLHAAAYTAHSYMWPVIGWMSDIQGWKMADLQNHWRMGYAPNNATLVVVGDVKAEEIVRLARKHLEPIPARELPPALVTVEPEQKGERRLVVRKPAQLPLLLAAYHIPNSSHPDYYPIQILSKVMGSGESSRLYKRLVDGDQLAIRVGGGSELAFDPGLFIFNIQPRAGVDPVACEKALYEELGRLSDEHISEAELAKAKNMVLAEFYQDIKTISGRGNALGTYELFFGDYSKLFGVDAAMSKVSAADIQRVARAYFSADNRTVATLIPEEKRK
ncbi:MAG TPA: pitrilysin family protein [Geothrix sp.]|nr:pitrilysin family protein [Geothrix sp.]